jgi:autotransporter-associated beta strand protein
MKTMLPKTFNRLTLLAISLSVCSIGQAQTTIIKQDTTTMDTAADWGGTVPSSTTIGQFDTTISSGNEGALTLGANISLAGLLFEPVNGPVTVGSGNTLTLGTNGINMSAANNNVTLNCGLTLASGLQQWPVTGGTTLTIGGAFTHTGALVDFSNFGGTLGTLGDVNGILGPWTQYGTGTSMEYATVSGGAVSSYSGGTAAATAAAVTDTTGTVNYNVAAVGTVGAGASFNTLRYTGATGTLAGNFTANGLMNVAAVQLTISSGITVGATGELVVNCPASAGASYFDFTGPFTNSGGTLTINIPNSSSIVDFGDGTSGAQFANFSGLIELGNSIGTLKLRSDSPATTNVDKGMGNLTLDLGAGSVNLTSKGSQGGTPTYNIGSLIGGVNTSLHAADASGTSLVTYKIGNRNLNSEFDGIIGGGTGTIGITKAGTGTWTVTRANTYGGTTTISGGTLSTGPGGTLANGGTASSIGEANDTAATLVLDGGTLQYASTNAAVNINRLFTLTANGGGLDASGANTLTMVGNGGNPIVCSGSGARTLTLTGTNTGANTFAPVLVNGTLPGATSLAKNGAGEWVLIGANTYSGNTSISNGTLALSGSGSIANSSNIIVSSGAVFDVSALSSFTLASGQSLLGKGTNNGSVAAASGSSIYGDAGAAYGTNTFNNNLTLASGAACYLDVGTVHNGSNDLIAVAGTLTLNNTVFILNAPSGSSLDASADYVLMTAGSMAGGSSVVSSPTWGVAPLNAANFSVVISGNTVTLHHTASTPPSGTGSASPATLTRNQSTLLSVTATPGTYPIGSVVVDTTLIGGTPGQHLIEVGASAVYTNTFTVGPSVSPGNLSLPVTIYDNEATPLSGGTSIALTIVPVSEVWGGGSLSDANWSDAANWLSGVAPQNGDNLIFAGTRQPTPNMDNSYSISALTFSNTAGSFVIGTADSSTLTLTGGVTNNSAHTETLNVPISLSVAGIFNAAAGNIAVSEPISDVGGGLANAGTNTLILSGVNTYTGGTTISSGTLQINDPGQLNSGAYGANIVDNGAFTYNSTAAQALSGGISGTGSLTVDSGTLTLSGANSYTNGTIVNGGSLVFSAGQAIPASGILTLNSLGSVTVTSASGLPDVLVNGTNSITGNGNSGTSINTLNLAGTLTLFINGGSRVFDLTGSMTGSGNLILDSSSFGTLRFNGTAGDGSAVFNLGTGSAEANVRNTATAIALGGLIGGSSTILAGNNSAGPFMTYTIGGAGTNTEFDGAINDGSTGTGSTTVIKVGTGTLTLGGTCGYNGITTISNGTLLVNGSISGAGAVAVSGGTLGGSGSINGAVTVQAGGTLAPGAGASAAGTVLTINNSLTLLAGTNLMQVSHNSATSDSVAGSGTITYGGTLTVVTNAGDAPFALGDTFTLFNPASVSFSGGFTNFNLPPLSPGLAWNTSNLAVNGAISVVMTPPAFSSITVSGNNILLKAIGGTPGGPVTVLSSTNLTLPLASWSTVTAGSFDGLGDFNYTVSGALSSGQPQQFYILKQ